MSTDNDSEEYPDIGLDIKCIIDSGRLSYFQQHPYEAISFLRKQRKIEFNEKMKRAVIEFLKKRK